MKPFEELNWFNGKKISYYFTQKIRQICTYIFVFHAASHRILCNFFKRLKLRQGRIWKLSESLRTAGTRLNNLDHRVHEHAYCSKNLDPVTAHNCWEFDVYGIRRFQVISEIKSKSWMKKKKNPIEDSSYHIDWWMEILILSLDNSQITLNYIVNYKH